MHGGTIAALLKRLRAAERSTRKGNAPRRRQISLMQVAYPESPKDILNSLSASIAEMDKEHKEKTIHLDNTYKPLFDLEGARSSKISKTRAELLEKKHSFEQLKAALSDAVSHLESVVHFNEKKGTSLRDFARLLGAQPPPGRLYTKEERDKRADIAVREAQVEAQAWPEESTKRAWTHLDMRAEFARQSREAAESKGADGTEAELDAAISYDSSLHEPPSPAESIMRASAVATTPATPMPPDDSEAIIHASAVATTPVAPMPPDDSAAIIHASAVAKAPVAPMTHHDSAAMSASQDVPPEPKSENFLPFHSPEVTMEAEAARQTLAAPRQQARGLQGALRRLVRLWPSATSAPREDEETDEDDGAEAMSTEVLEPHSGQTEAVEARPSLQALLQQNLSPNDQPLQASTQLSEQRQGVQQLAEQQMGLQQIAEQQYARLAVEQPHTAQRKAEQRQLALAQASQLLVAGQQAPLQSAEQLSAHQGMKQRTQPQAGQQVTGQQQLSGVPYRGARPPMLSAAPVRKPTHAPSPALSMMRWVR